MNTHLTTQNNPLTDEYRPEGTAVMLLHEDLARSRMRESQRAAENARLVRRLASARRWHRLARWVNRHASEANDQL